VSFQKCWSEDAVLHPGNVLRMQRIISVACEHEIECVSR